MPRTALLLVLFVFLAHSQEPIVQSGPPVPILKGKVLLMDGRVESTRASQAMVSLYEGHPSLLLRKRKFLGNTTTDDGGNFVFAASPDEIGINTLVCVDAVIDGFGTGSTCVNWPRQIAYSLDVSVEIRKAPITHRGPGYFNFPGIKQRADTPSADKFASSRVLFGTDRQLNALAEPDFLNRESSTGTTSFGVCTVTIRDPTGDAGRISRLFKSSLDSYAVAKISVFGESGFDQAAKDLITPDSNDALLFVHGYNTSFNDACRRAAQLAYDLKFNGLILLYSWPSHESVFSYPADEEMSLWSTPHFVAFLNKVLFLPQLHKLHVIAHSMGNRLVISALSSGKLPPEARARLGEVILAAPDVNTLLFEQQHYNDIGAQRITLYGSDSDQALRVSRWFHSYQRAGDVKPEIEIVPGVDSVDASAVDTSLLGHSYFGDSRSVVGDFYLLIHKDTRPTERFGLMQRQTARGAYWVIQP